MPQENLNKIWNAGKYFEEPKAEQPTKEPTPDETKPSNVKRKINVAKAFIPMQEDPFKQKVEAVMKGIEEIEPASVRQSADYGEEEKPIPADAEVIIGKGQDEIGKALVAGKSIYVKGNAGDFTGGFMSDGKIYIEGNAGSGAGYCVSGGKICIEGSAGDGTGNSMSGGEIHVKDNAGKETGCFMSGGILRIDGDVVSFGKTAFTPANKGTIIWKGETIWKNGQKEKPGWTNLNVEKKIDR